MRVLEEKEERALVIDCVKKSHAKVDKLLQIWTKDVEIREEDFLAGHGAAGRIYRLWQGGLCVRAFHHHFRDSAVCGREKEEKRI